MADAGSVACTSSLAPYRAATTNISRPFAGSIGAIFDLSTALCFVDILGGLFGGQAGRFAGRFEDLGAFRVTAMTSQKHKNSMGNEDYVY